MRAHDFPGQDEEHRQRRAALLAEERPRCDQIERVAAPRRARPLGKASPDDTCREGPVDLDRDDPTAFHEVRLSERFAV